MDHVAIVMGSNPAFCSYYQILELYSMLVTLTGVDKSRWNLELSWREWFQRLLKCPVSNPDLSLAIPDPEPNCAQCSFSFQFLNWLWNSRTVIRAKVVAPGRQWSMKHLESHLPLQPNKLENSWLISLFMNSKLWHHGMREADVKVTDVACSLAKMLASKL